jgi:hypothetical protein
MSQAAIFHLDGELVCNSIEIGIMPPNTPVVRFEVFVDWAPHLCWAIDEAAVFVYAYAVCAKKYYEGVTEDARIQVNVTGMPMRTNGDMETLFARKFSWHTSKNIREKADVLRARLTTKAERWPTTQPIALPVVPIPAAGTLFQKTALGL